MSQALPVRLAKGLYRRIRGFFWKHLWEPLGIRIFHQLLYEFRATQTWESTYWMGSRALKSPFDLWVYQEIIFETKPDLIIETGTHNGGSTLYLAHLLELMGEGKVLSIDIDPKDGLPEHPRIEYVKASSTAAETVEMCRKAASEAKRVMLILDSDHSRDHVFREMQLLAELVTPGCYMIVEDGNVNGHPVFKAHGPGPYEAIADYMATNKFFEIDKSRERFLVTFHPNGFMKRVR